MYIYQVVLIMAYNVMDVSLYKQFHIALAIHLNP